MDAALAGGDDRRPAARGHFRGARLAKLRPAERGRPGDSRPTDECLAGKSISDPVWAEVTKYVTEPAEQVEFVIAMGNWMSFSLLFRNLRIPLADGIAVWPPDGRASPAAAG